MSATVSEMTCVNHPKTATSLCCDRVSEAIRYAIGRRRVEYIWVPSLLALGSFALYAALAAATAYARLRV